MDDVSRGLFEQNGLLLLNIGILGPHYMTQLITRGNSKVLSKSGKSLPNEIWTMILKFAHEGMSDKWYEGTNSDFCLVKAELVSASPENMLIRCFRHAFDSPTDELVDDVLVDEGSVYGFERYLASTAPSTAKTLDIELPELQRLSGPDTTFDIILDTTSTAPYLYASLSVPDIIATINHGNCWVCREERFICPGCTGGIAQQFDVFMGCGVGLSCPLCMGTNFSQRHKSFLESNYWSKAPEDEAEDMLYVIEDRLEELGYADVTVQDKAWKGGV
ncbi:hypothetical protein K449DRAFT_387756 [Hypoxylon sp. EC38]|nr:hypothetical protein K449DRAFT_387756 [Hypoxylon sp. EC38]